MDWLWLLLLGFGTGAYGVLVGAGGGFILGPALLIFFGLDKDHATGTALALVAANTISGARVYLRMGRVDRRSGVLFALAAIPGSVIGAFALEDVSGSTFRILFGLLLVAVAVQMLVAPRISQGPSAPKKAPSRVGRMVRTRHVTTDDGQVFEYSFNEGFATAFNVVLGFISSFFGTGGGFLRTPILVAAFGFPVHVAAATSIFALAFYTTAGAATHAALGHVEWWPTFVWAGIGLVAGGQVGARLAGRVNGVWIMRLLLVVVLALGVRLLIEGVRG